jgi:hypothetical protein
LIRGVAPSSTRIPPSGRTTIISLEEDHPYTMPLVRSINTVVLKKKTQ